jgi:hypothetical protein
MKGELGWVLFLGIAGGVLLRLTFNSISYDLPITNHQFLSSGNIIFIHSNSIEVLACRITWCCISIF